MKGIKKKKEKKNSLHVFAPNPRLPKRDSY